MNHPRRFPLPWTIGEIPACYYVQDAEGTRFAYCYFVEQRPGYSHDVTKMTRDEARRIARNIAKLPELLQGRRAADSVTEPKGSDAALAKVAR
jgi:hypothetical protein